MVAINRHVFNKKQTRKLTFGCMFFGSATKTKRFFFIDAARSPQGTSENISVCMCVCVVYVYSVSVFIYICMHLCTYSCIRVCVLSCVCFLGACMRV